MQTTLLTKGLFIDQVVKPEIRMLTWKQPYGFLMLPPFDKVETRTWDTHYRGWVLIHAAKTEYKLDSIINISGWYQAEEIQKAIKGKANLLYRSNGKAFAIGKLEKTYPMHSPELESKCFVGLNRDLFCHQYSEVHPIKPIALKGKQGWSKVSDEIISKIEIVENFMNESLLQL